MPHASTKNCMKDTEARAYPVIVDLADILPVLLQAATVKVSSRVVSQ